MQLANAEKIRLRLRRQFDVRFRNKVSNDQPDPLPTHRASVPGYYRHNIFHKWLLRSSHLPLPSRSPQLGCKPLTRQLLEAKRDPFHFVSQNPHKKNPPFRTKIIIHDIYNKGSADLRLLQMNMVIKCGALFQMGIR